MGEDWRTWKVVLAGTRWHTCAVMKSCPWDRDQVEPVEGTGFRAYMSGSSSPCAVAGVQMRTSCARGGAIGVSARVPAAARAAILGRVGTAATARATAQTSLQSAPYTHSMQSDVAAALGASKQASIINSVR